MGPSSLPVPTETCTWAEACHGGQQLQLKRSGGGQDSQLTEEEPPVNGTQFEQTGDPCQPLNFHVKEVVLWCSQWVEGEGQDVMEKIEWQSGEGCGALGLR